jgi:hypothetical protein
VFKFFIAISRVCLCHASFQCSCNYSFFVYFCTKNNPEVNIWYILRFPIYSCSHKWHCCYILSRLINPELLVVKTMLHFCILLFSKLLVNITNLMHVRAAFKVQSCLNILYISCLLLISALVPSSYTKENGLFGICKNVYCLGNSPVQFVHSKFPVSLNMQCLNI